MLAIKILLLMSISSLSSTSALSLQALRPDWGWALTTVQYEQVPKWANKVYLSGTGTWVCSFTCKCGKTKEQKRLPKNVNGEVDTNDGTFKQLMDQVIFLCC